MRHKGPNDDTQNSKNTASRSPAWPTVLVVDSNPTIRKVVEFALQRENLRVLSARDGRSGLEIAAREPVTLVLLEEEIAHQRGFEFCRRLHHEAKASVVLIGAPTGLADQLRARLAGVKSWIPRPFEREDLTHAVDGIIAKEDLVTRPHGFEVTMPVTGA